ncbi:glycosyltransferase involved in cell wall biosynthesis [Spirosoma lacussanchae]|uniref:glycosyltransferase family 2 protein n=1 Tax=Spirosoma lacussanchae TaxID=1884249 RepID=UPI001FE35574|nr:glycosyltransferase [Spirosoma lacussanchae]
MTSVTGQFTPLPMGPYLNRIKPWVTVICTAYNHQRYVEEALQSVVEQDYPNVELIVIDNASTDATSGCISRFARQHPNLQFLQNTTNIGLNRAFNQGLSLARGRYVIDLSADDVLLPGRISKQVELFERLSGPYAVVFSNADYIDEQGRRLSSHYPTDPHGRSSTVVPSGNVFRNVLESYFICTPTMMIRRDVLNELGGYDESLAYEDFDFWVRSARLYHYAYLDEVLTLKRQLPDSLAAQVVKPDNALLHSSLIVCQKALERCHTADEYQALAGRIRKFIRKAYYAEQYGLVRQFGRLLNRIEQPGLLTKFVLALSRLQVPVNSLYRHYARQAFALPSRS